MIQLGNIQTNLTTNADQTITRLGGGK